jgi:hypothetical protein
MPREKKITDLIHRLAAAEERFLAGRFLAPVVRGRGVGVRIAGVVCRLRVEPEGFEGFGLFEPVSHSAAKLVRAAQMAERRRYLELFPALAVILVRQGGRRWLAVPAGSDARFRIEGLVEVHLVEEVDLFDTVRVRFDGGTFWFDEVDSRSDPGAAAHLRQCLGKMVEPKDVARAGLTAQQAAAYAVVHEQRLRQAEADRQERTEGRLREALSHAGAELREFAEREDVYRVSYEVDGRRHTSVVRKDDLTVQSAGVCLSGEDERFDLHSLVSVLREGERGGRLVRFGVEE